MQLMVYPWFPCLHPYRKEMLLEWHSKNGRLQGTYRNLIACFLKAGEVGLADGVITTLGYVVPARPVAGRRVIWNDSPPSGASYVVFMAGQL